MTKPITPAEAESSRVNAIPSTVIEAFNEMIKMRFRDGEASFLQKEIVSLICAKMECFRQKVFEQGWLNVESIYRDAGWNVRYDKPGSNETYEASYTFKRYNSSF